MGKPLTPQTPCRRQVVSCSVPYRMFGSLSILRHRDCWLVHLHPHSFHTHWSTWGQHWCTWLPSRYVLYVGEGREDQLSYTHGQSCLRTSDYNNLELNMFTHKNVSTQACRHTHTQTYGHWTGHESSCWSSGCSMVCWSCQQLSLALWIVRVYNNMIRLYHHSINKIITHSSYNQATII